MLHRQQTFAAAIVVALLLSATCAQSAAAAPNESSVDLGDAQAIVQALAPSFVGAPGDTSALHISMNTNNPQRSLPSPLIVATPADGQGGIGISIDYVDGTNRSESGEFTVFRSTSPSVAAYAHPTYDGVQIITAIGSAEAPDSYSYTLDVPAGTELISGHDGLMFNLVDPAGDRIGLLGAPWARDSSGRSVPTSFTWEGTTLTQHVDLSDPAITYPVIADPDWQYGVNYSLGSANPGSAWTQLHTCFNCYFPIEGAPDTYPFLRSDLPLVVNFAGVVSSFHCEMGATYNSLPNAWGWYFAADSGHIDGLGSAIFFDIIRNKTTGQTRLWVGGMVHNDFPGGLPNPVYVAFAAAQWQVFANNLSL